MRTLSQHEQRNIELLTENSISVALIEPTATGLKKSILDATGPVRNFLKKSGLHDYQQQKQGPDYKVMIPSVLFGQEKCFKSKASLYRPNTKKGDSRIWFRKLGEIALPNDILALIVFEKIIYVVNITQVSVEVLLASNIDNPLKELIQEINSKTGVVAAELLGMLRKVASRGLIPASVQADTAVGRALETALGIDINSSRKPDYKGIELKAFRAGKKNRKTLFAQVPNWKLSNFKSSAQILDAFGYEREEDFRLYCTVSAITRNSQGLQFNIDTEWNWLIENSDQKQYHDFAIWTLDKLHERLLKKHNETFWIAAETEYIDGKEFFRYKKVEHTKKPIVTQFDILLEQGIITMDHLIKRNSKGGVVEKGPLFKIKPSGLSLLFPPSKTYNLLE